MILVYMKCIERRGIEGHRGFHCSILCVLNRWFEFLWKKGERSSARCLGMVIMDCFNLNLASIGKMCRGKPII